MLVSDEGCIRNSVDYAESTAEDCTLPEYSQPEIRDVGNAESGAEHFDVAGSSEGIHVMTKAGYLYAQTNRKARTLSPTSRPEVGKWVNIRRQVDVLWHYSQSFVDGDLEFKKH